MIGVLFMETARPEALLGHVEAHLDRDKLDVPSWHKNPRAAHVPYSASSMPIPVTARPSSGDR